jgi:hypothetical protein
VTDDEIIEAIRVRVDTGQHIDTRVCEPLPEPAPEAAALRLR